MKKQTILVLLIVSRLVLGVPPSIQLLQKYQLNQFIPLISSWKSGNIKQFNQDLLPIRLQLVSLQCYMILSKYTRQVMLRNLIKSIYQSNQSLILKLNVVKVGVNLAGLEWDIDDIENCLVGLIDQGLVAGYISHRNCLVLSKKDPFPNTYRVYVSRGL